MTPEEKVRHLELQIDAYRKGHDEMSLVCSKALGERDNLLRLYEDARKEVKIWHDKVGHGPNVICRFCHPGRTQGDHPCICNSFLGPKECKQHNPEKRVEPVQKEEEECTCECHEDEPCEGCGCIR